MAIKAQPFSIKPKHLIEEVMRQQDRLIDKIESQGEKFLDAAARLGVNASKDKGRADTWADRTGNLRNSITHFLRHKPDGRPEAVVAAGMEYAVHVHFRDGYKVLVPPEERQVKPLLDGWRRAILKEI